MPNWCDNYLAISAEPQVIQALLEKATAKASPNCDVIRKFSYLPFVQDVIDNCENYSERWYEVNIASLGCKWFPVIEADMVNISETEITISFDSAWSPPLEGTRAIGDWLRAQGFHFTLILTYEEPSNAFCGVYTADQHGELDQHGDYIEVEAEELRQGKAEDYAGLCQSFGISFEALQARAEEGVEYVTLAPTFYTDARG